MNQRDHQTVLKMISHNNKIVLKNLNIVFDKIIDCIHSMNNRLIRVEDAVLQDEQVSEQNTAEIKSMREEIKSLSKVVEGVMSDVDEIMLDDE